MAVLWTALAPPALALAGARAFERLRAVLAESSALTLLACAQQAPEPIYEKSPSMRGFFRIWLRLLGSNQRPTD